MCQYKTITNLANFVPNGRLGQLFTKAKSYNQINIELNKILPNKLKPFIKLCLIKDNTATLITNNHAIYFRAEKQIVKLLEILIQIPALESITHVEIKININ
ncbi:hypothetical protein [Candidatus Vesicomyidisocius sp. SY067_SCS001]|uniref:hypothetical protein n=1 Tax=Candidatus Vesicomyidisocius sp. SY067_SCS001 TaxID=2732590 RepID=UPI001687058E|nr:hypothetical protein [Candidatus Vesicomyosocius sp. SY067_SCS001]